MSLDTRSTAELESEEYPFAVSAPGKVIVFGEHAVVYGKPAIAAALSLRSYLLVSRTNRECRTITLDFPDVKLNHAWNIEDLPWQLFHSRKAPLPDTRLDSTLIEAIDPHVKAVSTDVKDEHLRQVHQKTTSAFLYVLLRLCSPQMLPCQYTLRSTIPIASGLGSSASMSVCLSLALLKQSQMIQTNSKPSEHALVDQEDLINKWAFVGELCIHGNPSGIDNTVATKGSAVRFQRSSASAAPSMVPITFPTISSLIIDTNQPRSTGAEVAKVGDLKSRLPAVAAPILESIAAISETVHSMIKCSEFENNCEGAIRKLGLLVRINHNLLASLGVSHPKIEKIRQIIDHAEIGYTKLTGGGGGGCVFTILDPQVTSRTLRALEDELSANAFSKYETLLGAPGVGLLKIWQDISLSKKITERAFLDTPDRRSLEMLIGPTTNNQWCFWR